jgi:hypothetical protein
MRQTIWGGALLCGMALLGVTAQTGMAQTAMGTQQQALGGNQSVIAAIIAPVTEAPYQAEKVSRSVQKLGDGTVITNETRGLIARDAQGRIREDLNIVHSGQVNGQQRDMALQSATVGDPVTHSILIWTGEDTKVAIEMQMPSMPTLPKMGVVPPPPGPPNGSMGGGMAMPNMAHPSVVALHEDAPPPMGAVRVNNLPRAVNLGKAAGPKDDVRTEDLGQQSIEGVLVTGKRTTTTIPLGKVGNDRPIVVVHEEWQSPELKILVKTIDTDPRTGEQTMELQQLVRTDPSATLFQVPAGYKVQDMADMLKGLGQIGKAK